MPTDKSPDISIIHKRKLGLNALRSLPNAVGPLHCRPLANIRSNASIWRVESCNTAAASEIHVPSTKYITHCWLNCQNISNYSVGSGFFLVIIHLRRYYILKFTEILLSPPPPQHGHSSWRSSCPPPLQHGHSSWRSSCHPPPLPQHGHSSWRSSFPPPQHGHSLWRSSCHTLPQHGHSRYGVVAMDLVPYGPPPPHTHTHFKDMYSRWSETQQRTSQIQLETTY